LGEGNAWYVVVPASSCIVQRAGENSVHRDWTILVILPMWLFEEHINLDTIISPNAVSLTQYARDDILPRILPQYPNACEAVFDSITENDVSLRPFGI
jgi:hypothetical protein